MIAPWPSDFFHPEGSVSAPLYHGAWVSNTCPIPVNDLMTLMGGQAREAFRVLGYADPAERIEWLFNHKREADREMHYVSAWRVQPLPEEIKPAPIKG